MKLLSNALGYARVCVNARYYKRHSLSGYATGQTIGKKENGDLYRYLNFDQITGFEDEGRVIALEDMPKIEGILGIPAGVLS